MKENVPDALKRTRKWFRSLTKEQKKILYEESKKSIEKMLPHLKKGKRGRAERSIWHTGDVTTKRPVKKKLVGTKIIMKAIVLCLLSLTFLELVYAEDLKVNNKIYKDATILRVEPDGITYMHSGGVVKLSFEELPQETRDKYGYNSEKAKDYLKRKEQSQAQAEKEYSDVMNQKKEKDLADWRKGQAYNENIDIKKAQREKESKAIPIEGVVTKITEDGIVVKTVIDMELIAEKRKMAANWGEFGKGKKETKKKFSRTYNENDYIEIFVYISPAGHYEKEKVSFNAYEDGSWISEQRDYSYRAFRIK